MRRVFGMFSFMLVMFFMTGIKVNAMEVIVTNYDGSPKYSALTVDELKDVIGKDLEIDVKDYVLMSFGSNEKLLEDGHNLSEYVNNGVLVLSINLYKNIATEKKLTVNSIKPTNEDEGWVIFEGIYENEDMEIKSCNETYTKCTATSTDNKNYYSNVVINYNYDENTKKIVDSLVSKLPKDKDTFAISDLELFSYFLNGGSSIYYSSEFRSYLNNKNFDIDFRAGSNEPLFTEEIGIAKFGYNGTVYYVNSMMGVSGKHILYVPTGTKNADLLKTAQERLDSNFGKGKIVLTKFDTIDEFLNSYIASISQVVDNLYQARNSEYEKMQPNYVEVTREEIIAELKTEYLDSIGEVLDESSDGNVYKVTIKDKTYYTVIKADSDKMKEVSYTTSDILTDISISTESNNLPLDTLINVKRLTSGEEYEKILKILKLTDNEMFDLKLFSKALDSYVTKLDNGTFEVRIPVSEKFKDKELVAYYVSDDGKITQYEVTVKDGYAVFNTDHFSIYTLGVKTIENPKTGDNIGRSVLVGAISLISLIGCGLYLKKRYN